MKLQLTGNRIQRRLAPGALVWRVVVLGLLATAASGCQLFHEPVAEKRPIRGWFPENTTVRYQDFGGPSAADPTAAQLGYQDGTFDDPDASAVDRSVDENAGVDLRHTVLDVVIRGNKRIPTHHLQRHIGTRPGRLFDPDQLQQDVNALWGLDSVKRVGGPFLQRTDRGIIITLEIHERLTIGEVRFVGNRAIGDGALRRKVGLKGGEPLDVHQVRMARQTIEQMYHEKGYTRTQVEVQDGGDAGNDVVFLIHEDQRQKIWRTEFVGNTVAADGRLRTFIKSKPGILKVFGGNLVADHLEEDEAKLTAYYRRLGYFNARIGREVIESDSGWGTVRFIIDEGPRYRVRNVSVIGNERYRGDDLLTLVDLKANDRGEMPMFDSKKMAADVRALREMYGSAGHVFATVEAEPRFLEQPGTLDIVYKIHEGKPYRVGRINIHIQDDNGVTQREVVLNRLSLRSGDLINMNEIEASKRRLGATQIFATGPGQGPRIVVRPPELKELERFARGDGGDHSLH